MLLRQTILVLALALLLPAVAVAQPEVSERNWENLDSGTILGPIGTAPSCVSRMHARIDCFALGSADPGLRHREWNGAAWTAWENLGGDLRGRPECVSWGANRIDCFVRGSDNSLRHTWWEGAPQGAGGINVGVASLQTDALFWRGWENLGGSFTGEISCVSWDFARIDCFVRGDDNALWHRWWDGSQWGGWESLGGQISGRPECVSWSAFRIDCFALSNNGRMQHRWWNVTQWLGWEDLGGPFTGDISCVSHAVNRIDCFARGQGDNALWTRSWNGTQWIGENLGGPIKDPECISWGAGRIDCLARALDGRSVYHRAWDLRWRNWERLADSPIYDGDLNCTTWAIQRIDCFDTSWYNRLRHIWWDGQRWWPSEANPHLTPADVSPPPLPTPPPPPPSIQSRRREQQRTPREVTNPRP